MCHIYVWEPNAMRGIVAETAYYPADGSCPVGTVTWRSAYWSAQPAAARARAILGGAPGVYALCCPRGHTLVLEAKYA